jgi:hypothetical protein
VFAQIFFGDHHRGDLIRFAFQRQHFLDKYGIFVGDLASHPYGLQAERLHVTDPVAIGLETSSQG